MYSRWLDKLGEVDVMSKESETHIDAAILQPTREAAKKV